MELFCNLNASNNQRKSESYVQKYSKKMLVTIISCFITSYCVVCNSDDNPFIDENMLCFHTNTAEKAPLSMEKEAFKKSAEKNVNMWIT